MVQRLGLSIPHNNISKYELDRNEPPLFMLLAYSRLAEIPLEQIVDDHVDLTLS